MAIGSVAAIMDTSEVSRGSVQPTKELGYVNEI
jgi:hypothetical protein